MHVLFIFPYLPAPTAGHGSAQLVSRLLADAVESVRITLICCYRPHEKEMVDQVKPLCHRLVALPRPFAEDLNGVARLGEMLATARGVLATRHPVPVVKLYRRDLRQVIRALVAEDRPDLVHVEQSTMAQYVRDFDGVPAVLVDHEPGGPDGLAAPRWRRYLERTYRRFARVMTLCEEDARDLEGAVPGLDVRVRPVGVDLSESYRRAPEPGRVLFFGSAGHAPNCDALRWLEDELAGRIRELQSGAYVVCAGMVGAPQARAHAGRVQVKRLGFVTNLDSELARAAVVLSPARLGRGVRVKNLEAMARGVPLVTTTLGARGLRDGSNEAFAVADGADELTRATAKLLADVEGAETLGAAGRRLVERYHTLAEQARITLETWRELAAEPSRP